MVELKKDPVLTQVAQIKTEAARTFAQGEVENAIQKYLNGSKMLEDLQSTDYPTKFKIVKE